MSGWSRARRVLCVRLDSLGDVLMTTPALRALKRALPGRTLTLLTSEAGAAAGARVPEVDEVLVHAAPWMKPPSGDFSGDLRLLAELRRRSFDAAAVFTVCTQSALPAALACRLAGIPLRLAHSRENPYALLTDWVPETDGPAGMRHEVRRQLDLVRAVGCETDDERLSLSLPAGARDAMEARLRGAGLGGARGWVLMHPGASAPSRRYPGEGFAAAADELARRDGLAIVFSGSREEAPLVESIRARVRGATFSMAGRLDFCELAALVERAPVLVSNNTGPAHVAAALGTPVVDLYALTNPQHTPWGVPSKVLFHDVPCRFCFKSVCPEGHHDCLRRVPPSAVAAAARALLEGRRP